VTGAHFWIFSTSLAVATIYFVMIPKRPSVPRSIAKTAPLVFFALIAWAEGLSPFLTATFALSAIGDWALSRAGRSAFLYGLSSFALAHVLFVLAFLALSGVPIWDVFIISPLPALAMVGVAMSTEIWLAPFTGNLRWPVRGYVGVIALMMLGAMTLPTGFAAILLGAVLFVLSDIVLSLQLFRLTDGSWVALWAGRVVWVLYIGGQSLILWGAITP